MPADILSASLAERLRAHAGALKEISRLVKNHRHGLTLLSCSESLVYVAQWLELDAAESPREAKP